MAVANSLWSFVLKENKIEIQCPHQTSICKNRSWLFELKLGSGPKTGNIIIWFGSHMTGQSFITHALKDWMPNLWYFGWKRPYVWIIRFNTKPDWGLFCRNVHFSSWLQSVSKWQSVLTTKTQLLLCHSTKTDLRSLNQETNSLISSLNQPLNYRKRLPNASKPWSLSLSQTF